MASSSFRYWLLSAVFLMIGCPFLAVTFATEAGMGICFILFFVINPLFSIISGIWAGSPDRRIFAVPIIIALLFVVGVWSCFNTTEPLFLIYGIIYLLLGAIAMLLRYALDKRA